MNRIIFKWQKYLLLAAGFNITVTLLGFLSIDNDSSPYNDTDLQHSDINICVLNGNKKKKIKYTTKPIK